MLRNYVMSDREKTFFEIVVEDEFITPSYFLNLSLIYIANGNY